MPGKVTVFPARKIIIMTDAMPAAEAVAVAGGRFVAVGTMQSLKLWLDRAAGYGFDDRLAGKVLMPGLIDPRVHHAPGERDRLHPRRQAGRLCRS